MNPASKQTISSYNETFADIKRIIRILSSFHYENILTFNSHGSRTSVYHPMLQEQLIGIDGFLQCEYCKDEERGEIDYARMIDEPGYADCSCEYSLTTLDRDNWVSEEADTLPVSLIGKSEDEILAWARTCFAGEIAAKQHRERADVGEQRARDLAQLAELKQRYEA